MGMDGVEIVMAVEDAFDIRIEDAEAETLVTPRQLIELIQAKVTNVETSVCLSHRAFNWLRRHLMQQWNIPRNRITPGTKLATLIPPPKRKSFLEKLAAD